MLTKEQKNSILHLADSGLSYTQIAEKLNLSRNTVKSICFRNKNTSMEDVCKYCGKSIDQQNGKKQKVFCSHECSVKWWNEHNKAQPFNVECVNCGEKFISYGNPNKHYCSRKCYCEHAKQEKNHE